ncbi:MAG: ABC transporter permease [Clostridia bacterium]
MTQISKEHTNYLKNIKKRKAVITCARWGVLIVFVALWEILAQLKIIDTFIMSSPSRIWKTLVDLFANGNLMHHIGVTLGETIVGFVLSTTIGTLIAILLWWSKTLREVLEPHLIVLNALPKVALGPIIIIWVGAGQAAIVTMALLISVIVTTISTLGGFVSVEKSKLMLMQTLNASKWQVFAKLVLPYNIPTIIDALKINVGLSWVGTIMGEYLVSKAGLGYLIIYGGQIFKLDLVMTSIVVLCLLAALMYLGVEGLQKIIKRHMNFDAR